jgi:hypothetical protein
MLEVHGLHDVSSAENLQVTTMTSIVTSPALLTSKSDVDSTQFSRKLFSRNDSHCFQKRCLPVPTEAQYFLAMKY